MLQTKLMSSLHRVFPDAPDCDVSVTSLSAFQNEPLSFQVAFKSLDTVKECVYMRVYSDLEVTPYFVGYVSVLHATGAVIGEEGKTGLYPDMLLPKTLNAKVAYCGSKTRLRYYEIGERQQQIATKDSWQACWLTVNEAAKTVKAGDYPVTVELYSVETNERLSSDTLTVRIVPARLPAPKLYYTNWFHCDCLADIYGVPLYSDRFFEIAFDFMKKAAKNGMNMILTPFFTPALDTPVGMKRMNVQLVKVKLEGGKYSFDFSLAKRFIDTARAAGIKYFEHSHFFTQWGAEAAPLVRVEKDGREVDYLGWHTAASGKRYVKFLRAYIPAMQAFLKEEGLSKRVLFHISDEPRERHEKTFAKALRVLGDMLDGYMCGDALSDYLFYQKGYVKTPIVRTDHVHEFYGKCKSFWCYYTGGETSGGLSNRLILNRPEVNRLIGIEMYYHGIKGFLHWGYNYYYNLMSQGLFDPKIDPCGYNNHAGTCYFAYPATNGTAIESTRQKVFGEALLDVRALQALEKKRGAAFARALIERHFGEISMYTKVQSPEQLLAFREELNAAMV